MAQVSALFIMDVTHAIIALTGALAGLWLNSGGDRNTVLDRPCSCHCSCNIPESTSSSNFLEWSILVGVLGLLVWAIGTTISGALAAKIQIPTVGSPVQKGKSGKGVLGVSRGLQILDR